MVLEIAVFNIASALAAEKAGADRLELCENPQEGGTTPSYGTLKMVKEKVSIPVFPIIRPRGGDFLYTDAEFEVMKQDVQLCKELGFPGVVIGCLRADASIDKERTSQLVAIATGMEVTFHRAFDRTKNPYTSLEDIIDTGCRRVLTSGQVPNVANAIPLINELIRQADNRIIILQGSGVRSTNLLQLVNETRAQEYHSSARKNEDSAMQYIVPSMQENLTNTFVDEAEIRTMKKILTQT